MLTEAEGLHVMRTCGWWRFEQDVHQICGPGGVRDGLSRIMLAWTGEGYELTLAGAMQYLFWSRARNVNFDGDDPLKEVETRIVSELELRPAEVLAGSNPL